ncbi:iron chelate uptake ABC transporter family permease subunit [Neisseria leonii]|uniref:iron chelate uptake ABC transporter family permease subunit n=1 Tax=Neisseria leonii TaxID=2995413 RepID=UPI00237C2A31|nr:iron chelate uptake ABC transporter family permease subunit [Neisseria sp. 3986]MDD9325285.1 iron chelate uptake ABC transporter family permease subunit [Neisseria sp. 3986]
MNRFALLLPVPRAGLYACAGMILSALIMALSTLSGKYQSLLPQLPALLLNQADPVTDWLFWQLWLPRTVIAAGVGAALAVSGSIFQTLTYNPLGSPDIIGVNAGAAAGAVLSALIWPGYIPATAGALLGALAAVLLVAFAGRERLSFGIHMIVAGVAVNAAAVAVVQFGLTGVRQEDAQQMAAWLSGSLAQRGWQEAAVIWLVLPACLLVLYSQKTALDIWAAGRQAAAGVGINIPLTFILSLTAATVLAAAAVVAAGPVSFIALASPHIVKSMLKSSRWLWLQTALTGSLLLLAADAAARLLPFSSQLPVGVLTAALGGCYLLLLLIREWWNK